MRDGDQGVGAIGQGVQVGELDLGGGSLRDQQLDQGRLASLVAVEHLVEDRGRVVEGALIVKRHPARGRVEVGERLAQLGLRADANRLRLAARLPLRGLGGLDLPVVHMRKGNRDAQRGRDHVSGRKSVFTGHREVVQPSGPDRDVDHALGVLEIDLTFSRREARVGRAHVGALVDVGQQPRAIKAWRGRVQLAVGPNRDLHLAAQKLRHRDLGCVLLALGIEDLGAELLHLDP